MRLLRLSQDDVEDWFIPAFQRIKYRGAGSVLLRSIKATATYRYGKLR